MLGRPSSFCSSQFNAEYVGEPAGDLVLQSEQIASVTVEPLRPEMRVARGIDQLRADADLAARPPDAAFEYIAHTELAADLLGVDGFVAIRERCIARDDQHVWEPRQIGCQILSDTVCEVPLLRIIAEIGKRQDDDRQAWCAGCLRDRDSSGHADGRPTFGTQRIDPHWPG